MQSSEHLGASTDRPHLGRGTPSGPNHGFGAPGSPHETAAQLPAIIDAIAVAHRPSNMPFFDHLNSLSPQVASDPKLLGELYLVYQAAMHATRAAVYYLPHLDSPAMRKRKLQIFVDDDGLPGGDTHHYQLTRAFQNIGALCPIGDEEFGDAEELVGVLDARTAAFVKLAKTLYSRSLGPWCIVETMSDDWMHALASSLATHFPRIVDEPYFADCFSQGVEERHAEEAIAVTMMVLERRPELLAETIEDAKTMADALDGIWLAMDEILMAAVARHENECTA
ncbi:MAG: hypothetical protein QOH05_3278 [Acetobacteraceae bacterium]|jgi:hypothetical protein|nr:hypothetical protein [Acetobacteraceae bacterium]